MDHSLSEEKLVHLHNDLWRLLLLRLQLRTIYRLLFLRKEFFTMLMNKFFWRELVVRDLGPIPEFNNDYRMYYLKQMHFVVPLNLYKIPMRESLRSPELLQRLMYPVLLFDEKYKLQIEPNGVTLDSMSSNVVHRPNLVGKTVKKWFDLGYGGVAGAPSELLLLSNGKIVEMKSKMASGHLHLNMRQVLLKTSTKGEGVVDIVPKSYGNAHCEVIVTRSGKVYLNGKLQMNIEPMVRIDPNYRRLKSVTGRNYYYGPEGVVPAYSPLDGYLKQAKPFAIESCYSAVYDRWSKTHLIVDFIRVGDYFYFRGFKR